MTGASPDVTPVRDALLRWFDAHARDLPWRRSKDAYEVWVSEVMLQQTRVETVVPYYTRFLTRFPTVRALAEAPEGDVLALWAGLGYYRRAKLLHAGARRVLDAHEGAVPGDHGKLRALPGIGDYTAGAIGSIAFGLRVPLVDGNVERVLTRIHALKGDPRAVPLKKTLWALAESYADHPRPGDVNQSLMELGATVCVPVAPKCLVCPVRKWCEAVHEGDPERYPEKSARTEPRDESWRALVARRDDRVWLVPSEIGRWDGMLLPPLSKEDGASVKAWSRALAGDDVNLGAAREIGSVVHALSHARMSVRVFEAALKSDPARGRLVAKDELSKLAVPKITLRVLGAGEAKPKVTKRTKPSGGG